MEPRSCSHLHFIQAIRADLVEKIGNVDSYGRPALVFKKLKDIYECTEKLNSPSTLQAQDRRSGKMFDSDRVKTESQRLPTVEHITKKRDINGDLFNYISNDDVEGCDSDDYDFGKLTLKQLKEQCKTKKRELLHSISLTPNQDYTDSQLEADEWDLKEPISSWTSKLSKNLKGRRKCAKKSAASSSQTVGSVKCEQMLGDDDSPQPSGHLPVPMNVKVEDSGTQYMESRNMICLSEDSSIGCNEPVGLCGEVSSEMIDVVQTEKQITSTEESQSYVLNEVSHDYMEHIEPTCLLPSIGTETLEVDNLKKTTQEFEDMAEGYVEHSLLEESSPETSPVKDQDLDMCNDSQNNPSAHCISRQRGAFEVQVPGMATGNGNCYMEHFSEGDIKDNLPPNLEIDLLNGPLNNFSSSWNSNHCSCPETVLVSMEGDPAATEEPPVTSVSANAEWTCLSFDKEQVAFEGTSTTISWKQPPRSAPHGVESNSPKGNHHCDVVHGLLVLEIKNCHHLGQFHPPERVLSTRKAISPTSQEKLCQAMEGVEFNEDIDHYKCNEKLEFGKENEKVVSPAGLDNTEVAQVNTISEGLGEVNITEGNRSPRKRTNKLKNGRKRPQHRSIRWGPYRSRALPRISTGAASIQSCSQSAIAFSQRQMHDFECLATKLMEELKSMKDILQGRLHSEASPAAFIEYVDKTKKAAASAIQVEKTTRKWLSMMARDCNRFCTLMRLTENSEKGDVASGSAIHEKRRKITFADEAGGELCHVKFFEDNISSPVSGSFFISCTPSYEISYN